MKTQLRKVGNSVGSIIPAAMLRQLNLDVGTPIDMQIKGGAIVITPVKPPILRLPFSEADLLDGLDAHTAHADEMAQLGNSEWPEQ